MTLTATGSITTGSVTANASATGGGSGGSMSFNSGNSTFSLGSLNGSSVSSAGGQLVFYGSGNAALPGSPLALPTITFPVGASIQFFRIVCNKDHIGCIPACH